MAVVAVRICCMFYSILIQFKSFWTKSGSFVILVWKKENKDERLKLPRKQGVLYLLAEAGIARGYLACFFCTAILI